MSTRIVPCPAPASVLPRHAPATFREDWSLDRPLLEVDEPKLSDAERGVRVGLRRPVVYRRARRGDLDDEVGRRPRPLAHLAQALRRDEEQVRLEVRPR